MCTCSVLDDNPPSYPRCIVLSSYEKYLRNALVYIILKAFAVLYEIEFALHKYYSRYVTFTHPAYTLIIVSSANAFTKVELISN